MSYVMEVEVLDDEDQYNQHMDRVRCWWEDFLFWKDSWHRRNDMFRSQQQMKVCAKWLAHHAREAMKYKAVM